MKTEISDEEAVVSSESESEHSFNFGDNTESKKSRRRSQAWKFFEIIDEPKMLAQCHLCGRVISFKTSVSNLMKHARRVHMRAVEQLAKETNNYSILGVNSKNDTANGAAENDNEDEEVKKIYVSSDGKVYEIEGSTELNDQLHTNNDGEILFEQLPTPPKKRKRIKRDSQTESPDQSNTSSHPLDHLAKYLVSILKELPRPISSELQLKFVQQALEAKLKCDNDRTVNGDSTSDVEEK